MNAQLIKRSVVLCIVAAGIGGSGWWIFNGMMSGGPSAEEIARTGLEDSDNASPESEEIAAPTEDDFDRMASNSGLTSDSTSNETALVLDDTSTSVSGADADSFTLTDEAPSPAGDTSAEFELSDSELSSDTADEGSFDGDSTFTISDDETDSGFVLEDSSTMTVEETDASTNFDGSGFVLDDSEITGGDTILASPEETGQLQPLQDTPSLDPIGPGSELLTTQLGNSEASLPGKLQWDGVQTPVLAIEKTAPEEVQVSRPATFTTTVRNTGKVVAHGVKVIDYVPRGTQLAAAHPEFVRAADGSLVWNLGTIHPGEEASVSMKLIPVTEGEIGSVARVSFETQASARTISTRPQVQLTQILPDRILIGKDAVVNISVTNPGSGDATGVVIEADIPPELSHVAGSELEYKVGTLRPGQTKQLKLRLKARLAGLAMNSLTIRGEGRLMDRSVAEIEVVAPDLQVGISGPRVRYLDREATYAIQVANPGTASSQNVGLVAYLARGLKFISTDHQGEYDATEHAVFWRLEELPPNIQDAVKLTTVAIEAGEQKIRLEGTADLNVKDTFEHVVSVESVPELEFSVRDVADPIEVGSDTTYEIKVVNKGTRTATGIQIYMGLPESLRPVQGGGPTDLRIEGQSAGFLPLDRLSPGAEAVFRVKARAILEGDHVVSVQMVSDDVKVPVAKQESTRVYSDR